MKIQNDTSKNIKVARKLAITGALGALIILLGVTNLGMIPWISGASITTLHVPVILGTMLEGLFPGLGVGLIFGIYSLIQAAVLPTGPLDPFFTNPLVSVLPRLLIAIITWLVFSGLLKIKHFPKYIAYAVSAFFGSLANTIFVLSALALLKVIEWPVVWTVAVSNGILEAVAAMIICTAVMGVINVAGKKSRLSKEMSESSDSAD